jgi:tungstate transport system substrate-binding protein
MQYAALFNPYGVIAVNPQRHTGLNYQGAMEFIEFITSAEAKKIINGYKVNGEQLFIAE